MWLDYESCELEELVAKKSGKKYTAYALRGTKRGYNGAADEPYLKPLFENSVIAVKEKGMWRYGVSAVQYLQKACKAGDLLDLKFDRSCTPPELTSIENKSQNVPAYEPLTDEQLAELQSTNVAPAAQPAPAQYNTQAPAPGLGQSIPAQHGQAVQPARHPQIPF